MDEVSLAYATSMHKSQGSEYPAVVIPLAMQHYTLLERNPIYTAVTRGKKLVIIIGQGKALSIQLKQEVNKETYKPCCKDQLVNGPGISGNVIDRKVVKYRM